MKFSNCNDTSKTLGRGASHSHAPPPLFTHLTRPACLKIPISLLLIDVRVFQIQAKIFAAKKKEIPRLEESNYNQIERKIFLPEYA